ncbi:unnamed protein product [Cuscuta campestris]|uniref:Uncharacterized protein n=1 Tax=Cuscuta campestris TaxID=132261 RepID=A0A484LLW0_9ASTE|nr:unnamed protein product [Cuscuta campestris]
MGSGRKRRRAAETTQIYDTGENTAGEDEKEREEKYAESKKPNDTGRTKVKEEVEEDCVSGSPKAWKKTPASNSHGQDDGGLDKHEEGASKKSKERGRPSNANVCETGDKKGYSLKKEGEEEDGGHKKLESDAKEVDENGEKAASACKAAQMHRKISAHNPQVTHSSPFLCK